MPKTEKNGTRTLDNTCIVPDCGNPCWRMICRGCGRKIRMGTLAPPPGSTVKPNPPCTLPDCTSPSYTKRTAKCRAHHELENAGRPAKSLRTKRRRLDPILPCSTPGCMAPAAVRGMCRQHYDDSKRVAPRRTPCIAEGCLKLSARDRCKVHSGQFDRYGVSWNGAFPDWLRDRLNAERESAKPDCAVPHCPHRSTSAESMLCGTHMADRRRKGMDRSRYIDMFSILACESCGNDQVRLVTDHDHAHHPGSPARMCPDCYRGRICSDCNSALGLLRDGKNIRSLLAYAQKFNPLL